MTNNICQGLVQADASDLWYIVRALLNENISQIQPRMSIAVVLNWFGHGRHIFTLLNIHLNYKNITNTDE